MIGAGVDPRRLVARHRDQHRVAGRKLGIGRGQPQPINARLAERGLSGGGIRAYPTHFARAKGLFPEKDERDARRQTVVGGHPVQVNRPGYDGSVGTGGDDGRLVFRVNRQDESVGHGELAIGGG